MANPGTSDEEVLRTLSYVQQASGSQRLAAKLMRADGLGISRYTVRNHIRLGIERGLVTNYERARGNNTPGMIEVPDLPSFQPDLDELKERRKQEFTRRKAAWDSRTLIPLKVKENKPIGILWQGDPHLDDPGCDIAAVERDIDLCNKTDGLYRGCVGDYINNWRGRLAHMHAMQTTTQQEAWKLAEWFVKDGRPLILIAGNHDIWSGNEDPLVWFTRGMGGVYEWHGAKLSLNFPNKAQCLIHVRHDFPGRSVYNRAHGTTRAIRFGGRYHLYLNGHTHEWAYYVEENPSMDMVCHGIQLAAYKKVDDYATQIGAESGRYGESCLTIIDPNASPLSFVDVFWDVERGADVLKFLRRK